MSPAEVERRLAAFFATAGAEPVHPPVLQPAEPFLDLLGEDVRHRLYLTTDPDGRELCLRPDFTIPVAQHHIARNPDGGAGLYSYFGCAFRYREDRPTGEFLQAGIESFGRADTAEADADVLGLGLEAGRVLGLHHPRILVGDPGLFAALVTALDVPPALGRRLRRHFGRAETLKDDLARLALAVGSARTWGGILSAFAGADAAAARNMVEDLLDVAGTAAAGGRTAAEIAERFVEQAALAAGSGISPDQMGLLERYIAIEGEPRRAHEGLVRLAQDGGLPLESVLSSFARRLDLAEAAGVDLSAARFSTTFGRTLDYYTGFVFELYDPASAETGQVVGGGRYDRLLAALGAPEPVLAVGFSVWVDRVPLGGPA